MSHFLFNGTSSSWNTGEQRGLWGFPLFANTREQAERALRTAGLEQGCLFIAVVGREVRFVGRLSSNPFWDETSIWPSSSKYPTERYPLRVRFEIVQKKQGRFSTHIGNLFKNAYAKSLFVEVPVTQLEEADRQLLASLWSIEPSPGPDVSRQPVLPPATWLGGRFSEAARPEEFERQVGDFLRLCGLQTELLGHTRPGEEVPDGIGRLHASLQKWLRDESYFVLWDAKFQATPYRCLVGDRDAAQRYMADFASAERRRSGSKKCYFLFVVSRVADEAEEGIRRIHTPSQDDTVCAIEYSALRTALEELLDRGHSPVRLLLEIFPAVLSRSGIVRVATILEAIRRLQ